MAKPAARNIRRLLHEDVGPPFARAKIEGEPGRPRPRNDCDEVAPYPPLTPP